MVQVLLLLGIRPAPAVPGSYGRAQTELSSRTSFVSLHPRHNKTTRVTLAVARAHWEPEGRWRYPSPVLSLTRMQKRFAYPGGRRVRARCVGFGVLISAHQYNVILYRVLWPRCGASKFRQAGREDPLVSKLKLYRKISQRALEGSEAITY